MNSHRLRNDVKSRNKHLQHINFIITQNRALNSIRAKQIISVLVKIPEIRVIIQYTHISLVNIQAYKYLLMLA